MREKTVVKDFDNVRVRIRDRLREREERGGEGERERETIVFEQQGKHLTNFRKIMKYDIELTALSKQSTERKRKKEKRRES